MYSLQGDNSPVHVRAYRRDQNRRTRQSYVIALFLGDSEAAGGPLSKQTSSQLCVLPCSSSTCVACGHKSEAVGAMQQVASTSKTDKCLPMLPKQPICFSPLLFIFFFEYFLHPSSLYIIQQVPQLCMGVRVIFG